MKNPDSFFGFERLKTIARYKKSQLKYWQEQELSVREAQSKSTEDTKAKFNCSDAYISNANTIVAENLSAAFPMFQDYIDKEKIAADTLVKVLVKLKKLNKCNCAVVEKVLSELYDRSGKTKITLKHLQTYDWCRGTILPTVPKVTMHYEIEEDHYYGGYTYTIVQEVEPTEEDWLAEQEEACANFAQNLTIYLTDFDIPEDIASKYAEKIAKEKFELKIF